MSIPALERYPCPRSIARQPTNNWSQISKPTGGTYARPEGHGGSDIKPKTIGVAGDDIYPAWPGIVEETGTVWGPSYGRQVLVRHDYVHGPDTHHKTPHRHAWWEFHAHLRSITVKAGEAVFTYDELGEMGNTGDSTNVHDHCEFHTTNRWTEGIIDPYPRLNARRLLELGGAQPTPEPDPDVEEFMLIQIEGDSALYVVNGAHREKVPSSAALAAMGWTTAMAHKVAKTDPRAKLPLFADPVTVSIRDVVTHVLSGAPTHGG